MNLKILEGTTQSKLQYLSMSWKSKISKFEKTPIHYDPLLFLMAHFPKNGAFSNDLKGVVMKYFPRGKPPDNHFSLHIVSAPKYEFHSNGPTKREFFQAIARFLEYFSFHISIHNCTLILPFFAQVFGPSMLFLCIP